MNRKLRKPVKFFLLIMCILSFVYFFLPHNHDHQHGPFINKLPPTSDLATWQKINPEIFALLEFTSDDVTTQIPIIYTANGDHYMLHDIYGHYDTMGAVFMEKQISPLSSSNNYIINGHSSKTKNWNFTFLKKYNDLDYFTKHPEFTFIDKQGTHQYQIISFSEYDLDDQDTYLGWHNNYFASYAEAKNMFDNTLAYTINRVDGFYYHQQQMITLVTCNMQKHNARYVLQAVEKTERK